LDYIGGIKHYAGWNCIMINFVGTPTYPATALPHSSSPHAPLQKWHFTGPCSSHSGSLDHAYQLYRLANGRAGRLAGAQYKISPSKLQPAFAHYTLERSKQSTTHQEVTAYDFTAKVPSMDRALHSSAEAVLLSTFGLSGTHPLHRPVPHRATLPATSSIIAGPSTNQLSQQQSSIETLHLTAALWPIFRSNRHTN
jgi:hypothetical protein